MIHARTLGVLELTDEAQQVPAELKWRKNSALLLYLALSPDRARTREHLCGLLWPDKPDAAARHSLNEALRTIRKAIGEENVASDARQIRLSGGVVVLDVEELERAIESEDWDRVADLVGGTFLDGFGVPDASAFEDWLGTQRDAWRSRSVHALAACADARLAEGRLWEATELAARAGELDPFSDVGARVAIRAAALAGDRGEALSKYETFAARLREELGAEPAAETQRLADRVRRERTWRLPAAVETETDAGDRTELLGRETELRRALEVWSATRTAGRPGVLLIEGEPGAGKTRLLEELAGRVRLEGGVVAGIRAVPADAAVAWSALLGLCRGGLADVPGILEAPEPSLAALAGQLPDWKERFADLVGDAEAAPLARAFSDVVWAATTDQPVFLFVDDARWLDPDSRDGLAALLRDLRERPLLLALATVPDGREALDALGAGPGLEAGPVFIELGRWDLEACERLVAAALPEYAVEERARLARRIEADSAGLPMLAVKLVDAVRHGLELANGKLVSAWPHTDRTLEDTLPADLPDALRAAIRVRFRALSPSARTLLAAASVADDRFDPEEVGDRAGLSPEERDAALDELEWTRWLQSEPRGYAFVGRVVRDIVSEDLLTPGQRRRWSAAM